MLPNRNYKSEEILAYELGYRFYPEKNFFLDIAGFYNNYHDLLDLETEDPFIDRNPFPRLVIPIRQKNEMFGHTYGTEISLKWKVTRRWKLSAGYTWLKLQLHSHLSTDRYKDRERSDPENQFHLRSYLNLPWNIEFDSALYYVDHIGRWDIPSYVRLDARLGWKPTKNMNVSIVLQNLLDDHHPEYDTEQGYVSTEVERSIYLKMTWQF